MHERSGVRHSNILHFYWHTVIQNLSLTVWQVQHAFTGKENLYKFFEQLATDSYQKWESIALKSKTSIKIMKEARLHVR